MDEHSIRIEIAGRAYPLSIAHEEEANIRQAVKDINESVARLHLHYPTTDKQDLLAMAALEVTTRALNCAANHDQTPLLAELAKLEGLLGSTAPS